jgi:Tol biopolymer transport system component
MGGGLLMVTRRAALRFLVGGGVLTALNCGGGDVTNPPTTGSLRITSSTSGPTPDEDGYTITLDGTDRGALGTSGDVSIDGLEPGEHLVGLTGVAGNCSVDGQHPRPVTVTAGQSVTVGFAVTCVTPPPTVGSLRISTNTTGADVDPDGYAFAVDGGTSQLIGINATTTLTNVAAAPHSVQLSGLVGNCSVGGTNPRAVTVLAGATAEVSFAVSCATTSLIAFTSVGTDNPSVFVVKPDGTGRTELAAGKMPKWSPDGRKILFKGGPYSLDLVVMNADGSGRATLVSYTERDIVAYQWSPDGKRIAFMADECAGDHCQGIKQVIWVMNADGSGQLMLTPRGGIPSWSPDGRKLAFIGYYGHLYAINADGSGAEVKVSDQLSQYEDYPPSPSWSPDGAFIAIGAYAAGGERGIYIIHPDGTGMMNLTPGPGFGSDPAWSADGRKIAFFMEGDPLATGVAVVNRDGSGRALLMNTGNRNFDWSPDGNQIVIPGPGGQHDDLYVMNADGTGRTNVTNTPDIDEDFPDWGRH